MLRDSNPQPTRFIIDSIFTFRRRVFDCGTKVVLGLQESHELGEKIMIGTAFHHDPRWSQKYENDEDLHGIPDGISLKASLQPEQLIPYHNTLKANLYKARQGMKPHIPNFGHVF